MFSSVSKLKNLCRDFPDSTSKEKKKPQNPGLKLMIQLQYLL